MGGLAIRIQSPSAARPPYERSTATSTSSPTTGTSGPLRRLLEREGYVGDKLFNAIHGAQRLVYTAPDGRWSVDVVIDQLAMSHTIELKDRLATDGLTLDLADLLLTKLQIWETNRKDLGDVACLLADHPLVAVGRLVAAGPATARAGPDRSRPDPVRARGGLGDLSHRRAQPPGDRRAGRDDAGPGCAPYAVDTQVGALLADIDGAPRSRSAGRRGHGSASGSAGTRPPRRRAADRSPLTPLSGRGQTVPDEGRAPVGRPTRPGRRATSASSCSNGGMTSRTSDRLLGAALAERLEDPVGIDPAGGVALRP